MMCNSGFTVFLPRLAFVMLAKTPDLTFVGVGERWSHMERNHEPDLNNYDAINRHSPH
jgi:hypothetical protein